MHIELARRAISWNVEGDGSFWSFGCDWTGNDLNNVPAASRGHLPGSLPRSAAVAASGSGILCGGIFLPEWTTNGDGSYWASSCDWVGGDFTSALTTSSNCGPTCVANPDCTNFSWTDWSGGTCWMKKGNFAKSAAVYSSTSGALCGGRGTAPVSTSKTSTPTSTKASATTTLIPTSTKASSTSPTATATTTPVVTALANDRKALLQGVDESSWATAVATGAAPGSISIYSDQVAALLTDASAHVYIAHGRAGSGKFVAATHNDLLLFQLTRFPQLGQFWKNSLNLGRTTAPKVGCFPSESCGSIANNIQANSSFYGISGSVTQISKSDLKANSNVLSAVDVLYVDTLAIGKDADTTNHISALRTWLQSGGTVITAAIDWVWTDIKGGQTSDDPTNLLFQPYGAYFEYSVNSSPKTKLTADIYDASAYYAVRDLAANPGSIDFSNPNSTTYIKFASIGSGIKRSDRKFLDSFPLFKNTLLQLSTVCTDGVDWTVLPIAKNDYKRRSCTGLLQGLRNSLPLASHPLLQSASTWPGVPSTAISPTTKTWSVTTAYTKWLSTRLYATAGASVSVRFCPSGSADLSSITGVQIGSTTDEVARDNDDWNRFPIIHEYSKDWVADGACKSLNVSTYFGGLIYLDVAKAGSLGDVTVTGSVTPAPYYDGSQSNDEWKKSLDTTKAFYAELEFNGIIFSYPVFLMKQEPCSTKPDAVKTFFDKLMGRYFELCGETSRPYKERLNLDRDISVGGLHAGYPIQGYAIAWWIGSDYASKICVMRNSVYEMDGTQLGGDFFSNQGDGYFWGYVHELGHNFQKAAWTDMESNTEVTTNIFSIYMNEIFPANLDQFSQPQYFGLTSDSIKKQATWRASSQDYASADPFVKLGFYVNLRHAFGYEAFRRVFRAYLNMTSPPTTEQDQIDVWAKTFSQTVGYDISPFMKTQWKIPVSAGAAAAIAAAVPRAFNLTNVAACTAAATAFPFGLSPCASVAGSADRLTVRLSPWATLRKETQVAVGLSGAGAPSFRAGASAAVNTTVPLTGDSAALFGGRAFYVEAAGGQGGVLYLRPTTLIPFDTPLTVSADFSKATTKVTIGAAVRTTYWMETVADGALFMLDKRTGADVTY
ncbi:peptidase M60-like family-domain-containing protein [Zopfochytrium polystomum]|nr:peptidase M60-like family-domain-containing protein [Zopfochytrium polystomum]